MKIFKHKTFSEKNSMNSSSSEDEGEADVLWDNPKDVDWQFMKTGHSKLEGVVITRLHHSTAVLHRSYEPPGIQAESHWI